MRFNLAILLLLPALAAAQPPGRPAPAQVPPVSIEDYEPKSTLVVPQHTVTRAKYPFVDIHMHQFAWERLAPEMEKLNMRVMVSSYFRPGGWGEKLRGVAEQAAAHYPGRFVVFGTLDFKDVNDPGYAERAAAQVEADYKNGSRGLKLWKDFGLFFKDADGKRIPADDPRFDKVFEVCAKYRMPVLIHTADPKQFWEPMDKYNERWLDLKLHPNRAQKPDPSWETIIGEQHRLFERHKKTQFIAAHMGWLAFDLGRLGALLDRLPNVHVELSANVVELGRQPRAARQFFTKYQDRVLFGKDTWRPEEYATYFRLLETADEYFDHERKYQGTWKIYGLDLPDDVLRKLYYRNALRLLPSIDAKGFPPDARSRR